MSSSQTIRSMASSLNQRRGFSSGICLVSVISCNIGYDSFQRNNNEAIARNTMVIASNTQT